MSFRWIASCDSSGDLRSFHGFRETRIIALFDACALVRMLYPETPITSTTPSTLRASSTSRSVNAWVRSSDAASGSWIFTNSLPWSSFGMKPVGRFI